MQKGGPVSVKKPNLEEIPKGGMVGRVCHGCRTISQMRVPVYAGNASFFIALAVFPGLLLLLGVLS